MQQPPSARPELTHPCVRCSRPVPLEIALCELCNPLGLPQPASSQVHGSAFVAVVVGVILLALLGKFALSGIGPFTGRIVDVRGQAPSLLVTLSVTNDGTAAGSANCRLSDPAQGAGVGPDSAFVTSPRIEPGRTLQFTQEVTGLGGEVRPLALTCTGP